MLDDASELARPPYLNRPYRSLQHNATLALFDLFGTQLVTTWLPTRVAPIEFEFREGTGRVRIEGFAEAKSELLSYPDGSVIQPWLELPHGIEFKKGLMTNAKRWFWRDGDLLASYENKYGAVAKVKFTEQGCVG